MCLCSQPCVCLDGLLRHSTVRYHHSVCEVSGDFWRAYVVLANRGSLQIYGTWCESDTEGRYSLFPHETSLSPIHVLKGV